MPWQLRKCSAYVTSKNFKGSIARSKEEDDNVSDRNIQNILHYTVLSTMVLSSGNLGLILS